MFIVIPFLFFMTVSIHGEVDTSICKEAMANAGASEYFASHVAHAIHSMTVEDLKMFEATANRGIKVPTVNKNLNSTEFLLDSAPVRESTVFEDRCMRAADEVMSHMGEKWGIAGFDTLEQLLHTMHMFEVWNHIHPFYNSLKNRPVDAATCRCVTDLEQTGITVALRILAYMTRAPDPTLMVPKDASSLILRPVIVEYYAIGGYGKRSLRNDELLNKPYAELLSLITSVGALGKPAQLKTKEDNGKNGRKPKEY